MQTNTVAVLLTSDWPGQSLSEAMSLEAELEPLLALVEVFFVVVFCSVEVVVVFLLVDGFDVVVAFLGSEALLPPPSLFVVPD